MEYYISYIRGYFDGDGNISQCGRVVSFSIRSASKPVIEWIRDVFANQYGITNNKIYTSIMDSGKPVYTTTYYGAICKQIYSLLYNDNGIYLQRKYDKFTQLISPRDSTSLD